MKRKEKYTHIISPHHQSLLCLSRTLVCDEDTVRFLHLFFLLSVKVTEPENLDKGDKKDLGFGVTIKGGLVVF